MAEILWSIAAGAIAIAALILAGFLSKSAKASEIAHKLKIIFGLGEDVVEAIEQIASNEGWDNETKKAKAMELVQKIADQYGIEINEDIAEAVVEAGVFFKKKLWDKDSEDSSSESTP